MEYKYFAEFKPEVKSFFDSRTFTVSHVVSDPDTKKTAIIDSVMDYEPHGGRIYYESADKVIEYVNSKGLDVEWILETHAHADHLSASQYLKKKLGGKIGIGKKITAVQDLFSKVFDDSKEFKTDGSQFDKLFEDGETFKLGGIPVALMYTPGHTPADYTFVVGDAVFPGDTIFMPDFGSARCDFPKGSAEMLYTSVQKIFALPEEMRMFMCHDYLPAGRTEYAWETTVGEEKKKNIHLKEGTEMNTFVEMRNKRDETLDMPRLIIPSIQVNIRAGEIPLNENGKPFLKIPVNSPFAKVVKN